MTTKTGDKNEVPVERIAQSITIKAESAIAHVAKVIIKSDDDLAAASQMLSDVKNLQKLITQEKKKALDPIKQTVEAIKGWFAPAEEKADAAESNLKRAMASYQDAKSAEIARKQESIAKRTEAGQLKPETAVRKMGEVGEAKTSVKTESGSATFSKVKKVRIVDRSKVPDEFWVIDEVAVRSHALVLSKSSGGIGEVIPGVEVYEETVVSAK